MFEELPNTFKSFYDSILFHSIVALKFNQHLDNFDAQRYNIDGIDHSKEFNIGSHIFYFDWFFKNAVTLFSAYTLLGDEFSKRMYLHLIAYRLGGHLSVKLPVDFRDKISELDRYNKIQAGIPSKLSTVGMFGQLKHYDFKYENNHYVIDCLGLEYYLFRKQYFYNKNGIRIMPESGDFVIDGGACLGDTAIVFSNVVGIKGRVYAFDPVKEHLDVLKYNIAQFPNDNVEIMPYGLSNRDVVAQPIILGGQYHAGFNSSYQSTPLRAIDNLVKTNQITKIDFIKLDIEGAEIEALNGAEHSIASFKPKLAISLYHKPDDLFEIILYIKNRFPFYSCYINHHTIFHDETVLYCKP